MDFPKPMIQPSTTSPSTTSPPTIARMDALAWGGSCVGTIVEGSSQHLGKRVFVRDTIAGETAQIHITRAKARLCEAELVEVLSPSPERVTPPCPIFESCGGCDLQHINVKAQRILKRDMVASTLAAQAKLFPRDGVTLIGGDLPAYSYRRRITLQLSPDGVLGYFMRGSNTVVAVEHCPIAAESINRALPLLLDQANILADCVARLSLEVSSSVEIDDGPAPSGIHLACELRPTPLALTRSKSPKAQTAFSHLESALCSLTVRHKGTVVYRSSHGEESSAAGAFSQVNPHANEVLVQTVLDSVRHPTVTEYYAGAGNFSLALAAQGKKVIAVEANRDLVALGTARKDEAALSGVTFICARVEDHTKSSPPSGWIVLDPPRAGARTLAESFEHSNVAGVTYVSCNLPTLMRDLKTLIAKGFTLEKVAVVDMFPQTHHVEVVATIVR